VSVLQFRPSNGSDEDDVSKMMKRVEAKDAGAIYLFYG
jgi:hypothetical protein